METGLLDLELKEMSSEGVFEGVLAHYNSVDQGNDIIEPGAFAKTLKERGSKVPLLWQHKPDMPIGDLFLTDTPDALRAQGKLLMADPLAQKAFLYARAGTVKGLSIGYDTVKSDYRGSVRLLKELRLYEGSLVTFPMNEASVVTAIKSYLSPLLDLQPDDTKAGRVISAANRSSLIEANNYVKAINDSCARAQNLISALLDEAGALATSGEEAAEPKSKPDVPPHHLAAKILDDLRSLVPRV